MITFKLKDIKHLMGNNKTFSMPNDLYHALTRYQKTMCLLSGVIVKPNKPNAHNETPNKTKISEK